MSDFHKYILFPPSSSYFFFTESLSSHCVEDINSHAHLKKNKRQSGHHRYRKSRDKNKNYKKPCFFNGIKI